MKYLLIDTCSWINLIADNKDNTQLNLIKYWLENKYLKLLTHELIIEEWNKHKETEKERITKSLMTKYSHTNEVLKREKYPNLLVTKPNIENVEQRISSIDRILNDEQTLRLKTPQKIKAYSADRAIPPRKAPFHNKFESIQDAYIIFSILDYLNKNQIEELYFISDNKHDFGSVENIDTEIHPQIIEDYRNIKVRYTSTLGLAINELKHIFPHQPDLVNDNKYKIAKHEHINIDKTKPLLEQIEQYLKAIYDDINYLPIHILVRNYPFNVNGNSAYYNNFILAISNIELYKLFKEIGYSNLDGAQDESVLMEKYNGYDNKERFVLQKLKDNLIFHIEKRESSEKVSIWYPMQTTDPIKDSYAELLFHTAFNCIQFNKNDTIDIQLRKGYVNYQIGNYITAISFYKEVLRKATNENKLNSNFIAAYNITKLKIFIEYNYWNDRDSRKAILAEIDSINIEDAYKDSLTKTNSYLLDWIKNNLFYYEAFKTIQKITSKIIDHYYSQLNGGWSSNNNAAELINEYVQFYAFLSSNNIIYDDFSEFKDLFHIFLEGLLAAHAIEETQQGRIVSFDDYLVNHIVYYANPDVIIKYLRRYKLDIIKYQSQNTKYSLINITRNAFSNYADICVEFEKKCEPNNYNFWSKFSQIACNILVIASYVDFDGNNLDEMTNIILYFLKNENKLEPNEVKYVELFIEKRGDKFTKGQLLEFMNLTICNDKYKTNVDLFYWISKHLKKYDVVSLTPTQNRILLNSTPFLHALYFYKVVNDKQKKQLKEAILKVFERSNFDYKLFYYASINRVINLDNHLFEKYLKTIAPKANIDNHASLFFREKTDLPILNELINLCYYFDIDLKDEMFNPFRGITDYYDWLLNLKGFDYSKFNPKWVSLYDTRNYYKQFSKVPAIKQKILDYLFDTNDRSVERCYVAICMWGDNEFVKRKEGNTLSRST